MPKNQYRLDKDYIFLNKGKVQACQGDSGGAAFVHTDRSSKDGYLKIVGVNSFVSRTKGLPWTGLARTDEQTKRLLAPHINLL